MLSNTSDYYELMELSQSANQETIEKMFRYLATKWHPDAGGDKKRFNLLTTAFKVLRDPATRTAYDVKLQQQREQGTSLVQHAKQAGPDTVDRHKLLCLFYARRRQEPKKPALGEVTVEALMKCPREVLEFHLWYFREKGWIQRADNGGYVITADGVDRVESREVEFANHLRLESSKTRSNSSSLPAPVASGA